MPADQRKAIKDGQVFSIRVNGSLVFGEGRMKLPDQTYHGSFRGTIRAPSGLLRAGRNEIVLTLVRGPGEPEFFVGKFAVGAYGPLKAHYDPREFMLNGYATISMTLAFMVAALAVFGWARGGWSPYLGWLGFANALTEELWKRPRRVTVH